MSDAVFHLDGDLALPTSLARGPWTPDAQHGGAPAALLARAVEGFEGGEHMLVVRVTVELMRPVPIAPLRLATRLTRPGKKVQLVEAALLVADSGVEVARATGLRIRRGEVALPEGTMPSGAPPPPDTGIGSRPPWEGMIAYEAFHSGAIEMRFVRGSFAEPGHRLDPPARTPRRRRGDVAALARRGGRGFRERPRLGAVTPGRLSLHQPRPHDLPASASGRGVDCARLGDAA